MKRKGIFSFATIVLVFALICGTMTACGGGETKFQLNETEIEMEQYEEYTLTANKEGEIVWTSSDPRTVRVENGKLTSLKLGDAVITATLGEETAECEVTVKASSKGRAISVSSDSLTIPIGDTEVITAQLKENGAAIEATLNWTSDNPSVASVNNGTITGIASGTATITISTTYKGQALSKTVAVTCIDDRHAAAEMGLAADTDGTYAKYTGDVTELGFAAGTEVYEWTSATKEGSALWAKNSDIGIYERFIVDIMFESGNERNITVNNAGEQTTGCGGVVGTRISSILYYNLDGTIATSLAPETVYTLVVDLRKGGDAADESGIMFEVPMTAYIANAMLCSNEYYLANYSHAVPAEPVTEGLYMAVLEVAQGAAFTELSGKETEGDYAGMYKVPYMSDIWGGRLGVANSDMIGYQGLPALHLKYREYDYYGFDIVFEAAVPNLTVWTGGYAIFINGGVVSAEGGNTVRPDDIYIYDNQGIDVTGQALESGERYTFKIRIQKDDTDNAAFGLGVPGAATDYFYIGNPYFLKNS